MITVNTDVETIRRLKDGDRGVIRQIAKEHIPVVRAIVGYFKKTRHPRYADLCDMMGVAMLEMMEAINRCLGPDSKLEDNNISAYIVSNVKYGIYRFFRKNTLLPIDSRTYASMRRRGENIPSIQCLDFLDGDSNILERKELSVEYQYDDSKTFLELLKLSKQEEQILMMVNSGMTREEIGAKLGCKHQNVTYHLKKIKQRAERIKYRG